MLDDHRIVLFKTVNLKTQMLESLYGSSYFLLSLLFHFPIIHVKVINVLPCVKSAITFLLEGRPSTLTALCACSFLHFDFVSIMLAILKAIITQDQALSLAQLTR